MVPTRTRIFQIDAFTTRRFSGSPAAVAPLNEFQTDEVMQAIAAENNLTETAFIVRDGNDYLLRWFTPTVEVPPCGHATLASAAVVMERLEPGAGNFLALLDNAQLVRTLVPDVAAIAQLGLSGVIVTAPGDGVYDFVSRCFAPAKGIPEDPVTGAAHCALTPFWANRSGKTAFRAYQASRRGGEMLCRLVGNRVELEGSRVFYLEGELEI